MTQPSLESLFGGGGKALKFNNVGDTFGGEITDVKVTQQTTFGKNEPMFKKDGSPLWQVLVTVKTNLRDPEDKHDDGSRTLYVKGNMLIAVSKALKPHGLKAPKEGGTILVRLDELEDTGKGNPLKKYTAVYKPGPAPGVEAAFSGAQQQAPVQQQAYQPQQQAPVAQQAPQAQQNVYQPPPQQQAPQGSHNHNAGAYQQPVAQQAPQSRAPTSSEAALLAQLESQTL